MSYFLQENNCHRKNRRQINNVSLICAGRIKKDICFFIICIVTLLSLSSCSLVSSDNDFSESTSYLMNTVVQQKWYGNKAKDTCEEIEEKLKDIENRVSLYIENSEISQINDAAGKEYVNVSDDIFDMISEAKAISEESDGLFDITIAPLVLLWDITGDNPHVPKQGEIEEALKKVDFTKILLDEDNKSVMLQDEGMQIDLGGIAKGMAAGEMRSIAEENGVTGYLSIGGNMLVIGKKPSGKDINIGLRDPLGSESDYFAKITIEGYTMATSSASERYFEENGVTYHHILNPFTGYPGETDLLSVTVVSENGLLADALSTAIFLEGSSCLERYMSRDDCMVLAVTKDKKVYASEDLWGRITPTNTKDYQFCSDK